MRMGQFKRAEMVSVSGDPVMLEGVRVEGTVRGLLFEATVEQRFFNPGSHHIELVYSFPLPYRAVLLEVSVELGEQRLSGTVVGRRKAEADYEAALAEGDAAILLERHHDGSYSLNLGNLAAGERCVMTLRYAQTLSFEQQGIRLLIPTVIAPRYGDPLTEGGLQPHHVPEHSSAVSYPFELAIRVLGDLATARVLSPSHAIGVAHGVVDGEQQLSVTLGARAALDRDVVLVLDQLSVNSLSVLARDYVDPAQTAALVSVCPRITPVPGADRSIAVKLLVDCSGSMAGDSMAAARRALLSIVGQLEPADRFLLSRFGSSVEHRSKALWPVTEVTRLSAQRWIGDLDASLGGTEMASALRSTFAIAGHMPADVLLMTDGEIYGIDSLLETACRSGHRIFVVGIGSSVAEAHLRRLAEATGGACDFVAPGENVEPAIVRMFARLRSPQVSDLAVVWPEGHTPLWSSTLPRSVFEGDTVNLYALFASPPVGDLQMQGKRRGASAVEVLGTTGFPAGVAEDDTVSRMAAAVRIAADPAEDAATERAEAYQLVTDQTHFLLVHVRAEEDKADEMPELHKVNQMMPAGWGGMGSVMASSSAEPVIRLVHKSSGVIRADNPMDMDSISWRCSTPPPPKKTSVPDDLDYLDIPAFLRRSSDGGSTAMSYAVSEKKPRIHLLTPLEWCQWLRAHDSANWPIHSDELFYMGLDEAVIEWLCSKVRRLGGQIWSEQTVVECFLYVMSSAKTYEALATEAGIQVSLAQKARHWLAAVLGLGQHKDLKHSPLLLDAITEGLAPMTDVRWPLFASMD
jgi:Ca-activated chloride channel family protein